MAKRIFYFFGDQFNTNQNVESKKSFNRPGMVTLVLFSDLDFRHSEADRSGTWIMKGLNQ